MVWIKHAVLILSLLSTPYLFGYIDLGTHGNLSEPSEPDFIEEIKEKNKDLNKTLLAKQAKESINKAMVVSINLPDCQKSQTYLSTPQYQLEEDIYLPTGQLLYPKGYRFNILSKLNFPFKVVAINADDAKQIKIAQQTKNAIYLVGEGDIRDAQKALPSDSVFVLDKTMSKSFGINCLPSILEQQSDSFIVNEIVTKELK